MHTLRLIFKDGHIFVEIERNMWLFDTGAPTSFGDAGNLSFAGEQFAIKSNYMGLTAEKLSRFVGVRCFGLIGADICSHFDHIFNCLIGTLTVSNTDLPHNGQSIHVDEFMGIPIVTARIAGNDYQMFFDTGAQFSYFQDNSLSDFPSVGSVTDFYPGFGQFQTDTHEVPVSLGNTAITLRCGVLPGLLGLTLKMAGTHGIIGNQLLTNRIIGYFPRRGLLFL